MDKATFAELVRLAKGPISPNEPPRIVVPSASR